MRLTMGTLVIIGAAILARSLIIRMRPPVDDVITSPFGDRYIHGGMQHHNGVDIRAAVGTEVLAPYPGQVIGSNMHSAGGLQLFLKLDNGMNAGFAHLSKVLVKPGDPVEKGQVIALSGKTGTIHPHLHFSLRDPDGNYFDPAAIINFPKA